MIHVARALVAGLALATTAACAGEPSSPETAATPSSTATTPGFRERECAAAADAVVAAVERLVAGYAGGVAVRDPDPADSDPAASDTAATGAATSVAGAPEVADPSSPDPATPDSTADDLATAVTDAQRAMDRLECDPATFTSRLGDGLSDITPDGPIASAVLRRVSASVLGEADQDAAEHEVANAEELLQALAQAAPGSTIVLPPGTLTLDTSLVLLDGVAIRGSEDSTLESSAAEAAIIVATDGLVELNGLTLDLTGDLPASGLIAGPSASVRLADVRISGATAGDGGAGGAGVHMTATGDAGSGRGTTLEVTDSTFEENAWAGIVVAGGHRVSIERTTFVANGEVGVLFLDSASGSVTASTFTGNTVGLAATGESEPVWLTSTVSGGEIGIQIEENSTAVIEDVEVRGTSSAAVIVRGAATGAISGLTCTDVEYGLVIEDTAAPTLADNACELARAG